MKMKEVCALTGLTERTIRFYAEKGLAVPKMHRQNGRDYSDYSAADVDALRTVATLRRMLFSVEEISRMRARPQEIPAIVGEYRKRMEEEAEVRAEVLALDVRMLAGCKSAAELAHAMSAPAARRKLPESDVSPDFSRFEPESQEDKEAGYRRFLADQLRQEKRGFIIVALIAAVNVLLSIVSLVKGSGSVLTLILQIVFSAALLFGQTWARILFIVGLIFSAACGVWILFSILWIAECPAGTIVLFGAEIVFSVAGAVVLICSKSVKEFMYRQKNG